MSAQRPDAPVYRRRDLPALWEWPFHLGGVSLFIAIPVGFAVSIGQLTPGLVIWMVAGLMLGALLLAVPSWLRYNLALYHTRPLPDRTVEAFEAVDRHMRALHEAMEGDRRAVDELRDRLRVIEECRTRPPVGGEAVAPSGEELETALVELKLELDHLTRRWNMGAGEEDEPGGKPLPANLLKKAMSAQSPGQQPRLIRRPPGAERS